MSLSDNDIIAQVKGGSKPQFARLVDRYKHQAMTLAVRMLKNRQDAEEAVQDAFIRAYNALDRFEGTARFGTWLYRIVYNVCLTRIGKRRAEFEQIEYEDAKEYSSEDEGSLTGDEIESKDLMEHILRIMATLPTKYSTILSLFYVQELSHDEIAHVTQLPVGTIKTHLFRARARLQQELIKELRSEIVST
jgi:RNA polymerase sigma-70 factor (ECF subfamily)